MRRDRFERLLRWYPRAWREHNAPVVLDTMLEEAERQGRAAPTGSERLSAMIHGLGARLDATLALRCALAALLVAALAGVVFVWWAPPPAVVGLGWVPTVFGTIVGPALVVLGAIALTRARGPLTEPRALLVLALALPALVLRGLTQFSWAAAFNAADRGLPDTGFTTAWPWLAVAGWLVGAAAIGLFVEALLPRPRRHRAVRMGTMLLLGAVAAPVAGAALLAPSASAIGGAAVAALSLILSGSERRASSGASAAVGPDAPGVTAGTRRLVRGLAWLAAVSSAVGILYALSGTGWFPGASDATTVMAQGITIALVSALPLLAAIGVHSMARGRRHPVQIWGPLLLVALAFAGLGAAYFHAPVWEDMAVGFAAASVLGGTALGWWVALRLPGALRARVTLAVALGLAFASFLGMLLVPVVAFALPLLAAAFAIWGPRDRRTASGGGAALPSPQAGRPLPSAG